LCLRFGAGFGPQTSDFRQFGTRSLGAEVRSLGLLLISVLIAGAAVQRLRDGLGLIKRAAESGQGLAGLRVDGGACANDFLMQFQADLLGVPVERPKIVETTALGAALLAGLGAGVWKSANDLERMRKRDRIFKPRMKAERRDELCQGWRRAVAAVRSLGSGE
jgi:glycerol kinase